MSLASDIIRELIAADVAPADLELAAGLIEDAIPTGAGLAAINVAITKARETYGPLFVKAPVAASAPSGTTAHSVAKATEMRRQVEALDAIIAATGNPYVSGNLTARTMVEARDPARAAKLKAEAAR